MGADGGFAYEGGSAGGASAFGGEASAGFGGGFESSSYGGGASAGFGGGFESSSSSFESSSYGGGGDAGGFDAAGAAFRSVDANNDGSIDRAEFNRFFQQGL